MKGKRREGEKKKKRDSETFQQRAVHAKYIKNAALTEKN